jgi:hypothetical protein
MVVDEQTPMTGQQPAALSSPTLAFLISYERPKPRAKANNSGRQYSTL